MAGGAVGQAVHVDAARMPCPNVCFHLPGDRGQRLAVMLLHPHVPHGKPRSLERTEELVAGVEQTLKPGPRCRPHGQHAPQEAQGTAMGGQLGTGQAGPGLPESGQVALPLPLLLEIIQTGSNAHGRRCWRGQQQRQVPDNPRLQTRALAGAEGLALSLGLSVSAFAPASAGRARI